MELMNSTEGEQNPNAVFQGLGLRGWLKVIFRTRAGLIKQGDKVIDNLFDKLNIACEQANTATAAAAKFAQLVIQQNEALVAAQGSLCTGDGIDTTQEKIDAALEAAKAHL